MILTYVLYTLLGAFLMLVFLAAIGPGPDQPDNTPPPPVPPGLSNRLAVALLQTAHSDVLGRSDEAHATWDQLNHLHPATAARAMIDAATTVLQVQREDQAHQTGRTAVEVARDQLTDARLRDELARPLATSE